VRTEIRLLSPPAATVVGAPGACGNSSRLRQAGVPLARPRAGPRPIAVYLEPCPLLHEAVATLLSRVRIRLVAATAGPERALELLRIHHPELFLLELETPGGDTIDGTECLRRACRRDPWLTAVVLTSRDASDWEEEACRLGASAYLHKSARPGLIAATILAALERARCGEPLWSVLTPREHEILTLVSGGRTNAQVGRLLWVSPDTVKFHLANVYRKLGVSGRSEAARWARLHVPALGDEGGRWGRSGPEGVQERDRVDPSEPQRAVA
jgi:DNA-binding NarL/FixJ family response regulator